MKVISRKVVDVIGYKKPLIELHMENKNGSNFKIYFRDNMRDDATEYVNRGVDRSLFSKTCK